MTLGARPPAEVAHREVDQRRQPVAAAHQQHHVHPDPAQPGETDRAASPRIGSWMTASAAPDRGRDAAVAVDERLVVGSARQQAPDLHPRRAARRRSRGAPAGAAARRGRRPRRPRRRSRDGPSPAGRPRPRSAHRDPAAAPSPDTASSTFDTGGPDGRSRRAFARRRRAAPRPGRPPSPRYPAAAQRLARAAPWPRTRAASASNGASTLSVISTSTTRTRCGSTSG